MAAPGENIRNEPKVDAEIPFSDETQKTVYHAAVRALKNYDDKKVLNVKTLISRVSKAMDGSELKEYQIYLIIKDLTTIAGGEIRSRQGRNGGYYRTKIPTEEKPSEQTEELSAETVKEPNSTFEKHLWPAVSQWFRDRKEIKNATSEIANLKGGGFWSNPDVVGLNIIEDLGFFDVEVYTAEVKPTISGWRRWFFEAVSHKRFSERTYFVYRDDGSALDEEKSELMRYAEKYDVGVIEMQLDEADYKDISTWIELSGARQAEILEKFVELIPAPFEPIPVRDKIVFLRRLGIDSKQEIYDFGRKK